MPEEIWILEDQPIRVSFETHGSTFYKGLKGILGAPPEAFLRLIAVKGEHRTEIQSVSDLRGRVTIQSPEQALEFVRLFTSIETQYLFPDVQYVEPDVVDDSPGMGKYTEEYGKRMKLEAAKSSQEGDFFLIERNLVDRAAKLFRATERVGRDGDYSLLKTAIIDESSPVMYPVYQ